MKSRFDKKSMSIVLLVSLVIGMVGCSKKVERPTNAASTDKAEVEKVIRIGTGPSGSANYITVSGIGSLVIKAFPNYKILADITTGSQENIRLIQNGTALMGISMVDVAFAAYNADREFKGGQKESIKFVMGGYPTLMHFMVPKDSKINSFAELKGKKLGVSKGAMSQYYMPIVLEAYGIAEKDVKITQLQLSDICNAIADGTVDFGVHITPYPSSPIADLATTKGLKLLEIDMDKANRIIEKNPYFFVGTIKGGTYTGIDKDVKTLGTRNTLIAKADAPDDIIYNFLKVIIENHDKLGSIHPKAAEFSKENALEGKLIPLHPGAEKYYKEIGVVK